MLGGVLFAVGFSRGVLIHDQVTGATVMHVIGHQRYTRLDQRMITACVLKSPQELVLGTALGTAKRSFGVHY